MQAAERGQVLSETLLALWAVLAVHRVVPGELLSFGKGGHRSISPLVGAEIGLHFCSKDDVSLQVCR
jgi:hypothetical protein